MTITIQNIRTILEDYARALLPLAPGTVVEAVRAEFRLTSAGGSSQQLADKDGRKLIDADGRRVAVLGTGVTSIETLDIA